MTNKIDGKNSFTKRKVAYALFGVVALLVLFLCIGVLRRVVYGVFGYAIYAYLPALLTFAVMLLIGKKTNVSLKRTALYITLFFMVVTTLHIGLSKSIIEGDNYLANTYSANTVGGVTIGLLAGLFRLICAGSYGFAFALSFVITAAWGLVALYPLITEVGKGKEKSKNEVIEEKVAPEAPSVVSVNPMRKNSQGLYTEDATPEQTSNFDQYFNADVLNVSGTKGELFSSLTSDEDKMRYKADQSANMLFGEEPQYRAPQKPLQERRTYNVLESLGTDDGYNYVMTNQQRMRLVEENLRMKSPEEEYAERFGGGLEDGYATARKPSSNPSPTQYGSYEPQREPVRPVVPQGNESIFGGYNQTPRANDYYQQALVYQEPVAPAYFETPVQQAPVQQATAQPDLTDRAKLLDYINTPITAEEYVNMDVVRPIKKDVEVQDTDYMFDDTIQRREPIVEEPVYTAPVVTEPVYTAPQPVVQPQPVVAQQAYVQPQRVEQPVVQPQPVYEAKQPVVDVQSKFNIPQKQPKQVFDSIAMGKEKAPDLPKTTIEPKKPYVPKPYKFPSYDFLQDHGSAGSDFPEDYQQVKAKLDVTMQEFNVPAEVYDAKRGPAFTMYYLKVGAGYKLGRISSLKENLKMRLCVKNLRILAPIEGEDALGIELPNSSRDTVGLRSILCSRQFNESKKGLMVGFGKTIDGEPFIADITKMPHLLVAGSTGTGKSVFLNCILTSLLYKYSPEDLRLILIDPKRVELSVYRNLPNLLIKETIKEPKHAVNALRWLCQEMDRRYKFFEQVGCANIDQYNEDFRKPDEPKMYRIVLVIDEMADLMIKSKDNTVEECIVRIAQLARACGIHMIIATQRPTVQVITGLIKSNILHRVAFTVKSNMDSRVILDDGGAEDLLGLGDMLYSFPSNLKRMQGAFVDIREIKQVCDFIRENNEGDFDDEIAKAVTFEEPKPVSTEERSAQREEERDAEFERQLRVILKSFILSGRASVSSAQASHRVGYIKAKKLVDAMTERGFLSEGEGAKPREILITLQEYDQLFGGMDSETASEVVSEGDDE